jgi:hypothetical protein
VNSVVHIKDKNGVETNRLYTNLFGLNIIFTIELNWQNFVRFCQTLKLRKRILLLLMAEQSSRLLSGVSPNT